MVARASDGRVGEFARELCDWFGFGRAVTAESLTLQKFPTEQLYRWAAFLGASLMAALFTPDPIEKLLRVLGIHSNSVQLGSINEWGPALFGGYQPIEIWLALFIGFFLTRGVRLPYALILLFGLIHMALAHVRHAELMVFVAPLLVASSVGQQLPPQGNRTFLSGVVLSARGWLALSSVVLAVFALIVADRRADWRPPTEHSPVAAVQAVRAAGVTGRVFKIMTSEDFWSTTAYQPSSTADQSSLAMPS